MASSTGSASALIILCSLIALIWALINFVAIKSVELEIPNEGDADNSTEFTLLTPGDSSPGDITIQLMSTRTKVEQKQKMMKAYNAISLGAEAFLRAEYSICAIFVFVFGCIIFGLISWGQDIKQGALTTLSFFLGSMTSIASGNSKIFDQ